MTFTKIPESTFEKLQINAGVLLSSFNAEKGPEDANLIGATSGGVTFTASPTFSDWGSDVDNCPVNMKELKHLDSVEVKLSGTFVTIDTALCKSIIAAADVSGNKITPRGDLKDTDFTEIHWVGDYGATDGSYIHICIKNALNTSGFQLKSSDKAKGQFAFEYTGHYSMEAQDEVPYYIEIVSKEG